MQWTLLMRNEVILTTNKLKVNYNLLNQLDDVMIKTSRVSVCHVFSMIGFVFIIEFVP